MNASQANSGDFFANVRRRLNDPDTRTGSIIVLGLLVIPLFLLGYMAFIMWETPAVEGLSSEGFQQSTVLYTSGGKEITRYYEQNRRWVPLDSIADIVPKALVAAEDRRFYRHQGIDVQRTAGAILQTATGNVQGGSTITMQLVRNMFPDVGDDFALTRKFKEWFTALRLEDHYSKKQLLEFYLNSVPFGYNTSGVEAAAETYFNESALEIDTLQAAQLVGMLKATSLYDPVDNPEEARERRNVVLDQLRENGVITNAAFQRLREQETPMGFAPVTPSNNMAPFFAAHARQRLSDWAKRNGYNLYTSGLKVYTTLDAKKQKAAQEAVDEMLSNLQDVVDVSWSQADVPFFSSNSEAYASQVNPETAFDYYWESHPEVLNGFIQRSQAYRRRVEQGRNESEVLSALKQNTAFMDSLKDVTSLLQAGFTAMEPQTGYIRAWVGGKNFEKSQYDHVAQAQRQPGSTFNPFVYSAAVDEGYRPNDMFIDEKVTYTFPQTGRTWSPGNFGRESRQPIPMRKALAQSKNTVTSQLAIELGPGRIADQARRMGIESELNEVPSLALGTSPVTLQEMIGAYGVLANQGTYRKPVFLKRIETQDGRVLARFGSEGREALSPSTAYTTLDMMRGVISGGTGIRMRSEFGARGDLAGKTGTTQDNSDGWFMLLHPDLAVGAWVGFNSPQITFRTRYWGQGSHNALKIVGNFYQDVNLSTEARFEEPGSYVEPQGRDTSGGTMRVFAEDGLQQESESRTTRFDTLDTGDDEEFDFEFDTDDEEIGSQDVSESGTFSTGETSAGDTSGAATGGGAGEEQQADEELAEQSEPQSEADQQTREAREDSQVRELLEQQEEEQQQQGGGDEDGGGDGDSGDDGGQ